MFRIGVTRQTRHQIAQSSARVLLGKARQRGTAFAERVRRVLVSSTHGLAGPAAPAPLFQTFSRGACRGADVALQQLLNLMSSHAQVSN
jgi:hypothetical protein